MKALSLLWHIPGRIWAGMIRAAPVNTWLTAGAGMAWTLVSGGLVWFFRDRLGPEHAFWIVESALGIVFVAILAQTGTELGISANRQGFSANVGRDVEPVATVTTTTTVEGPHSSQEIKE